MNVLLLTLSLSVASEPLPAPDGCPPCQERPVELPTVLLEHNQWRKRSLTSSMSVLLGWSVANMGVGAVGWGVASDPEWVAFHQMNLAWNTVNLSLAIPGLVGALRSEPGADDLRSTLRSGNGTVGSFALNTGLDVGWMATGAWLWERGVRQDDPRLLGFGKSMVMQGGFLLVFDAVNWAVHGRKQKQLFFQPVVGQQLGVRVGGTL